MIKCVKPSTDVLSPTPNVIILDGAVIVQMLATGTVRTFEEYAQVVFLPYVWKQLDAAKTVDIVWDEYREDSLKKEALVNGERFHQQHVFPLTGNVS